MTADGKTRVLLAGPVHDDARALVAARGDIEHEMLGLTTVEDLAARIADLDALVLRLTPLRADLIAQARKLKVVSRFGVGYDNVDVPALTAAGIPLMVVGDANAVTVAEHAIGLMIAASRRIIALDRTVRACDYGTRTAEGQSDLWCKTLLIVGYGRVGRQVAKRCAAFEMRIIVADPYADRSAVEAEGYRYQEDFRQVLPEADFVTLHLPGQEDGQPVMGQAEFGAMKAGAFFVNVARGTLVDETALAEALTSGQLRGAGLDVTRKEPPAPDCPLLPLDSIVFTPHSAALTEECNRRQSIASVQNALNALDGRLDPAMVINKDVLQ